MYHNKITENKRSLENNPPETVFVVSETKYFPNEHLDHLTSILQDMTIWEKPAEWFWEIISVVDPYANPAPNVATHADKVGLAAARFPARQNWRFGAYYLRRNAFIGLQQAGHPCQGKECGSIPARARLDSLMEEQNHAAN